MDLNERFDTLDDHLKLDPAVRDRAVRAHNEIGDLLVDAGVAKRTRLQGSLARHTMRGPQLHDIDKIVELEDDLHATLDGRGGPERAMTMIRDVLAPHLANARFEIKKHALAIALPDDGFNFDAVPAFNPEDGAGWINIADTDDDAWEPSNTYMLIDTVSTRNLACAGRFVHQVRMAKQAVDHAQLSKVLPGLHVESFAYYAIQATTRHPDAVAATLATGARLLDATYTDPTGVDRISERLDPADRAVVLAGMQRLAELAEEAQQALTAGDETAAARIWADVFGDQFPRPATDEKGYLQGLHLGTGVSAAASSTPTTRAWRPG